MVQTMIKKEHRKQRLLVKHYDVGFKEQPLDIEKYSGSETSNKTSTGFGVTKPVCPEGNRVLRELVLRIDDLRRTS